MTHCPICLAPAHAWECSHAALMARVAALSAERDATRRLASAKAADVDRLLDEQRRDLADVDRFRAMARRHQDERDEARAQLADTTGRRESVVASITLDAPVELHTRDGVIRVRKLVHAKADPRIGELTAKVRAGNGTVEDLQMLCDVAERVALLEALVAEKDEALAKADAAIARLNRGAH